VLSSRCAASAGKTPSALDGQDFAVLYQLLPDGALETCAAGKEKIRALLGEPVRAPRAALEASAGHNVQMSWRRPMHMTTKCSRPFVGTIKWHRAAWRKPLQHGPHHGPHRTAHKSEHMRKQCAQTPRLARKQSSAQMHNCADTCESKRTHTHHTPQTTRIMPRNLTPECARKAHLLKCAHEHELARTSARAAHTPARTQNPHWATLGQASTQPMCTHTTPHTAHRHPRTTHHAPHTPHIFHMRRATHRWH
jgi:hypothetical protein